MTQRTLRQTGRVIAQAAALAIIAFVTAGPSAQGLGDVAKKEAERRQQVPSGKRYTNGSLPADSSSAPAAPASAPATSPTKAAAATKGETSADAGAQKKTDPSATSKPAAGESAPPERKPQDEGYWRAQAKQLRSRLQQVQERVRDLESRADDLGGQLERKPGGSAASELDVTTRGLANAKEEAQLMQAEWDRFQLRARALKVPSDWIQ
jgi:hypothetical protein